MIFIFLGIFLLLATGQGEPIAEVDIDTWKAPADVQKDFPYYLSGYDAQDRPIWVFEIGHYPIKSYVSKGPETIQILETYMDQVNHRIRKSLIVKNSTNVEAVIITDFDGINLQQFSHHRTLSVMKRFINKIQLGEDSGTLILLNVSSALKPLINMAKRTIPELNRALMLGKKKEEWLPKILEMLPVDQLPQYYGGSKDFKPLQVYG